MWYVTLYWHNSHFYVQHGITEKALAYVGIRENAGKEGILRPEPFVLKVGVPTLQYIGEMETRFNKGD